MKKKSILNRPMFKQIKSPAYGTGIASNLVSDEERQRYNYGGRVRAADGYPSIQAPDFRLPKWYETIDQYPSYAPTTSDKTFEEQMIESYTPGEGSEWVVNKIKGNIEAQTPGKARGWGQGKDISIPRSPQEIIEDETRMQEGQLSTGPSKRSTEDIIADETIKQRGQLGGKDLTTFKEPETDTLDVDPFAFLDKNIEEKKKLAKGNALMKAAAAAVKWGGAPTAEKRAAAISEGLTGFGDEASKATAAAMDLKDRARILAATQGMKDEAAYARQELQGTQALERQKELINYYDRRLEGVDPNASLEETYQSVTKDTGGKDYYSRSIALQEVLQGKGLNVGVQLADTTNDNVVKKIQDGVIIIDSNTGRYFQKKGAQLIPTSRKEIFATLEKS